MRRSLVLVGVAALGATLALSAGGAMANPGGGGTRAPSVSVPSFDPAAEYARGIAALKASDFKAAERSFNKVAGVAPKDANTQVLLGMARGGQNNWKGAQKAYEKALKLDADLIPARRELALALARQGQADRAQAELATLKSRAASCADACAEAAALKDAVSVVETALTPAAGASPAAAADSLLFADAAAGDGAYFQAVGLINERRYDEALAALGAAAEAFGPHPDVLTYIGFTQRKLGRPDLAEAYYQRALEAAPDHREAMEYYGELKVERGDRAGARALLVRLEQVRSFGCPEAEKLRLWIEQGPQPD
jgi:Tfp pilus assembly protein PilF